MITVDVEYAGELRHVFDISKEFITELSQGEWDNNQIEEDARSLSLLLQKYATAVVGDREDRL